MKENTILTRDINGLREELSRGCDYSGTQEEVHDSFLQAIEQLGSEGDWDEMDTEDLTGQKIVLQSLFEAFYDITIEKVMNYIESYKESEK